MGDDWHNGFQVSTYSVEKQFEFVLGQCETKWTGNLLAIIESISARFLFESSLERPDTVAVIVKNDIRANRSRTTPDDNIAERHPPHYNALSPAPTASRTPAVEAAQSLVDRGTHVSGSTRGVPEWTPKGQVTARTQQGSGPFPVRGMGATAQYPAKYAARVSLERNANELYREHYLSHPSDLAKFDPAHCGKRPSDDRLCFPYVVPRIGYTHRRDGSRIRTDRGQLLEEIDPLLQQFGF